MSIQKHKVAVRVCCVSILDHVDVSDSTQVQNLVRDECIAVKEGVISDKSVSMDVKARISTLPDFFAKLDWRQVLHISPLRMITAVDCVNFSMAICANKFVELFWSKCNFLHRDYMRI